MRSIMKNSIINKIKSAIVFFVISPVILSAQWDINVSTSQEYNSNPFRSPLPEANLISSLDLGLQREIGQFNLLYYGSYTGFDNSQDRNYYWHQLGLYKENENSMFGIYGEQRINKTDYNYFDYYNLTGYYRQKIESQYFFPTISFSGTFKKYLQLSEYDNFFLNAGISLNKGFESKTTLILSGTLNYKYYFNSIIPTQNVDLGMYSRRGQQAEQLTTTQLYTNLRIAQSLFENTGLAVYYTNRFLFGDNESLNSGYDYGFGDESDLFDDPVSRNENAFGAELTQIMPEEIIFKAGYEFSSRLYPSQGIYINAIDYEAGTDRTDEQNYFYFGINKIFSLDNDEMFNLNTGINYGFIDKNSNSYWYEYSGSNITLNLSLQF